jgi:predicted hotdog family 3-hydroxylacyl-ACP dehydratase
VTGPSGPAPDRPLKIEGLIPHRRPMLAVDELISLSEDEAVSRTVIRPDSFFLDARDRVEESLLFEMTAQTFAALAAASARPGPGGPEAGFLVAVKKMDFFGRPEVGTAIEITVRVLSRVDDFSVVSGRAVQAGRLLAEGQVNVFVPGSGSTAGGRALGES